MKTYKEFVENDLLKKCRSAILNNFQFLEDDMKVREFKEIYLDKEKLQQQLSQLQQEKEELVKDLKQFLNEWDEDDYVSKSINLILSKLKGE